MLFKDLNLIEPIQRALQSAGYQKPTPIQEKAIPIALKGRDLLACAQTGTGKTAAFAVPILQLLHQQKRGDASSKGVKALILAPTRELAIQIGESFQTYGKYTRLKHTVIFGGVSQNQQTQRLEAGVDILVATPGRLLDLINQGYIDLQHIAFFVLDEADRMLDMGFIHDVRRVIRKLPSKRQTFFFSATMPNKIVSLSKEILTRPEKVAVDPVSSTAERVEQAVYFVPKNKKRALLLHLLKADDIDTALVFTRTKHGANRVVRDLGKKGVEAAAIHGNKSQNARQKALRDFKARRINVLVATDIAARGIDVENLSHVINFDLPNISETYVHRIGRTGRAGACGIALSFCDTEEKAYLRDIEKLTGQKVAVMPDHPYTPEKMADTVPPPAFSNGREKQARPPVRQNNNGRSRRNGRRKRAQRR